MKEKEVGEIYISNSNIEVDLDTIIKEAISSIKMHTRVKVVHYKINGDKISLTLEGDDENVRVLKDRLGVQEETNALSNSAVDKVKMSLSNLIRNNFDEHFDIKLKSMDNFNEEMVHIALEVNICTIPYPISVQYHIADDGYLSVSYSVFGDANKDERWGASSTTAERLIEKLKEIEEYYGKRQMIEQ